MVKKNYEMRIFMNKICFSLVYFHLCSFYFGSSFILIAVSFSMMPLSFTHSHFHSDTHSTDSLTHTHTLSTYNTHIHPPSQTHTQSTTHKSTLSSQAHHFLCLSIAVSSLTNTPTFFCKQANLPSVCLFVNLLLSFCLSSYAYA
jgi:hypothetical protein